MTRSLKDKCRSVSTYLVKVGVLVKPERCEKCDKKRRLEMHHANYAYPKRVDWWCPSCHRRYENCLRMEKRRRQKSLDAEDSA